MDNRIRTTADPADDAAAISLLDFRLCCFLWVDCAEFLLVLDVLDAVLS